MDDKRFQDLLDGLREVPQIYTALHLLGAFEAMGCEVEA
jgi:hypothetical protein